MSAPRHGSSQPHSQPVASGGGVVVVVVPASGVVAAPLLDPLLLAPPLLLPPLGEGVSAPPSWADGALGPCVVPPLLLLLLPLLDDDVPVGGEDSLEPTPLRSLTRSPYTPGNAFGDALHAATPNPATIATHEMRMVSALFTKRAMRGIPRSTAS